MRWIRFDDTFEVDVVSLLDVVRIQRRPHAKRQYRGIWNVNKYTVPLGDHIMLIQLKEAHYSLSSTSSKASPRVGEPLWKTVSIVDEKF